MSVGRGASALRLKVAIYQVRRAAIADAAPRITEIAVQNAALVLSDADACIAVKTADVPFD